MNDARRTVPWTPSQKCVVNGVQCVYETSDGRVLEVILPGGRKYLPPELQLMGYRYEPPQYIRINSEGVA